MEDTINYISQLQNIIDLLEEKFHEEVKRKATYNEVKSIRDEIRHLKDKIKELEKGTSQ